MANEVEWSREFARSTVRDALAQIIDDNTPGLIERLANDLKAYQELLAVTHLVAEEAEELLRETALSARHAGLNWEQVGQAVELDRQAAQRRFGPKRAELDELSEPDNVALLDAGNNFSPQAAGMAARVAAALTTPAGTGLEIRNPRPYPPLGTRGTVTEGDDNRWTFNTAGQYGWHPISFSGWTWTVVFDNQQWEFDITTGRAPKGEGWQRIGRYAFAVYWTRPTGRPILPGNPDPAAFQSQRKLNKELKNAKSMADTISDFVDWIL